MDETSISVFYRQEVFFQHPVTDFERSIEFYKKLGLKVSKFSEETDNFDEIEIMTNGDGLPLIPARCPLRQARREAPAKYGRWVNEE